MIAGELAGFRIEFRPALAGTLTLHGAASYQAKISVSPAGIIASLEHAVRSIDERIEMRRSDHAQTQKNLAELSALMGKPFEHEARYLELQQRQSELVQGLDITKNQASSQLAAESAESTPEPLAVSCKEDAGPAPMLAPKQAVRIAV